MDSNHVCPVCGKKADKYIETMAKIYLLDLDVKDLEKKLAVFKKQEAEKRNKEWPTMIENFNLLIEGKKNQISNLKKTIV